MNIDVLPEGDGGLFVLAVVAVVVLVGAGGMVMRWRREAAMRSHAGRQGWPAVGESAEFGGLVADAFPELREEAEHEARATRGRSGGRRGRGPGLRISLGGGSASARSRARGRNVFRVPVDSGELAVGDVTVTGGAGKLNQGRSSVHRGAVAGRVPDRLPPVKLVNRSRLDRDGDSGMPGELAAEFTAVDMDAEAKTVYIDSQAWRPLLDAAPGIEGVAVADSRVVVVARKRLTPDSAAALADAAEQFASEAVRAGDGPRSRARLSDPLSTG